MSYDLTPAVAAMKDLHLEGNIIPMEWFSHITFDNGRPDTNAILILSDIVYWYRPTVVRDEHTGLVVGYRKKFKADLLQKNYQDYEVLFGLSKKQIRDAFIRLEEIGVVRRVLRTVETAFGVQGNVMFIELFPEKVRLITHKTLQESSFTAENKAASPPLDIEVGSSLHQSKEVLTSMSIPLDVEIGTYTKITPEITPKTTPASSAREDVSQKMLEVWDHTLQPPVPVQMTPWRSSRLKAILAENFQGKVVRWEAFCQEICQSAFLMGQGTRGWRVTLDWVLKPQNLQKVLEGHYRNGQESPSAEQTTPSWEEMALKAERQIESLSDPLFQEFCRLLLRYIPPKKYLQWFSEMAVEGWNSPELKLIFPARADRNYVEQHFSSEISSAVQRVSPESLIITYAFRELISSPSSSKASDLSPLQDQAQNVPENAQLSEVVSNSSDSEKLSPVLNDLNIKTMPLSESFQISDTFDKEEKNIKADNRDCYAFVAEKTSVKTMSLHSLPSSSPLSARDEGNEFLLDLTASRPFIVQNFSGERTLS